MLTYRMAKGEDIELLYKWANDKVVRENSYSKEPIDFTVHTEWFRKRINSPKFAVYIFFNEKKEAIGQVRIEKSDTPNEAVIGMSVDEKFRAKGLSSEMLCQATANFLSENPEFIIFAFIFKTNQASYRTFLNSGFVLKVEEVIKNIPSYILYKKNITPC